MNRHGPQGLLLLLVGTVLTLSSASGQWTQVPADADFDIIAISAYEDTIIICGQQYFAMSTNKGSVWQHDQLSAYGYDGSLEWAEVFSGGRFALGGKDAYQYEISRDTQLILAAESSEQSPHFDVVWLGGQYGASATYTGVSTTKNNGESYDPIELLQNINTPQPSTALSRLGDSAVLVVGSVTNTIDVYGVVSVSSDRGETWTKLSDLNVLWRKLLILSVTTTPSGHIWVAGRRPKVVTGMNMPRSQVLLSRSGGHTWDTTETEFSSGIVEIVAVTDDVGFCLDDDGRLFKTTNGGRSWVFENVTTPGAIWRSLSYDGTGLVYVGGNQKLYRLDVLTKVAENEQQTTGLYVEKLIGKHQDLRSLLGDPSNYESIQVYDISGNCVAQMEASSSDMAFPTTNRSSGYYTVVAQRRSGQLVVVSIVFNN